MTTRAQRKKRDEKRQRRMERREEWDQREAGRRVRRRLRTAAITAVAIVAVVGIGGGAWFLLNQPRPGTSVSTSGASIHSGAPNDGYSTSPPTSGPHTTSVPPWGESRGEIADVVQVHGLEHGGVLVQFNCPTDCPDLRQQLRGITGQYNTKVILAPYSKMDDRIALTSWGQIDLMEEFDLERIAEFVDKNRNHAPENNAG